MNRSIFLAGNARLARYNTAAFDFHNSVVLVVNAGSLKGGFTSLKSWNFATAALQDRVDIATLPMYRGSNPVANSRAIRNASVSLSTG